MVRSYTNNQLIARAKAIANFMYIPHDVWILGVRSNEDTTDVFDDKFYIFRGEEFLMVTSGTTNKGLKGSAVMKSDWWNYEAYKYGLHRGRMKALKQVKSVPYYRDHDNDGRTDESGQLFNGLIGLNFHGSTYIEGSKRIVEKIGGWSEGCQVCNKNEDYEKIIRLVKNQSSVTYCLINEF